LTISFPILTQKRNQKSGYCKRFGNRIKSFYDEEKARTSSDPCDRVPLRYPHRDGFPDASLCTQRRMFLHRCTLHLDLRGVRHRPDRQGYTVLLATTLVIAGGAFSIFLMEYTNPRTLGIMSLKEKILVSYFSSVTARTAGFTTVDYSLLETGTLFLTITLMFIGASPGGTGGGVKTSTVTIVITSLYSTIRGKTASVLFKRRVPSTTVAKAFLLMTLAVIFCTITVHLIITTQDTQYLHSAFEVTSTFGTVGLSTGDGGVRSLTAAFTPAGKIIIVLTMFVGRLGPLTLAVAMTRRVQERFRYPEGKVIIG